MKPASRQSRAQQATAAVFAEFLSSFAEAATPAKLRAMLSGKWLSTAEILANLGLDPDRARATGVSSVLIRAGARRLHIDGKYRWTWNGTGETRPAAAAPGGPALEAGAGEKRDCRRWTSCITAFAMGTRHVVEGHCPRGCAYFLPIERARLLRKACEDISYAQRGANFGGAG